MLASLIVASMLVPSAFAGGFGSQVARRPTVQDLAWMAGCWELTRGTRRVTEQWMRPEGGTLMGMSRTTADGTTVEYEFLVIRRATGDGGLLAAVEGDVKGQRQALQFPYRRVACGR